MKILVCGFEWLGHWTEYTAAGFEKNGHETMTFFWTEGASLSRRALENVPLNRITAGFKKRLIEKKLKEDAFTALKAKLSAYKPDLVFVNGAFGSPLSTEQLFSLKKKYNTPFACWYGDDPLRSFGLTGDLLAYDQVFLIDPYALFPVKMIKPACVDVLLGAADEETYRPVELSAEDRKKYACDIAFAGTPYLSDGSSFHRAAILASLVKYRVRIHGNKYAWTRMASIFPGLKKAFIGDTLTACETNKLYNAASVCLNIHHPQLIGSTSLRTFELAAAGAFQLADERPGRDLILKPGKDLQVFKSIAELKEKAAYYIKHGAEAGRFAASARKEFLAKHTYVIRLRRALSIMKKNGVV